MTLKEMGPLNADLQEVKKYFSPNYEYSRKISNPGYGNTIHVFVDRLHGEYKGFNLAEWNSLGS